MSLAGADVMAKGERFKLPNFKLGTVLKHYGINTDKDQLHDALYDARQTMALYDKIMGRQSTKT